MAKPNHQTKKPELGGSCLDRRFNLESTIPLKRYPTWHWYVMGECSFVESDRMMFLDSPATPEEFVEACRRYKGLRHSMDSSYVIEGSSDEKPVGFLRCVGVPLAGFRRVGLLPADFDLNITRDECFSMLRENFHRVNEMRAGDLLFLAINGPDELEHIAVYTERSRIIHALNDERGVGRVFECGFEPVLAVRSIYRFNGWRIWGID